MKKNYNELILSKISTLLPSYIKISDFLMDALEIGREASYRRIRNEVPFSLDEIAILSSKLNFSIDEIIGGNNLNGVLLIKSFTTTDEQTNSVMYNIMVDYHKFITKTNDSDYLEIIVAANQLFFLFFVDHLLILKFFYYKWMRQNNEISVNSKFSEIDLPQGMIDVARNIRNNHHNIRKLILIFDENIFLSLFKEIQHFYFRKLITDDELVRLKEEMDNFLDFLERLSQDGKNPYGAEGLLYLSSLNIGNNQMYIKHSESALSAFFISSIIPILITQPQITMQHEKWLASLKKYAVLIAASNEIYQTEFFVKQHDYLKQLGENIL